jgi:imidazolonepropionase-like amidohydrolase
MKRTVIKATTLFDGAKKLKNKYVVVEGDRIVEVTSQKMKYDFEGIVTPAFIDPHSHIGLDREGEPWTEGESNDVTDQFMPLNDPINSIYFDDRAFKDAVDFGVLYSCILPGSGNMIAGQAQVIKNFATGVDNAFFRNAGMKMALGYNPRTTEDWKGVRPTTRMGLYAMLEKKFDDLLLKREKELLSKQKKLYGLNKKLHSKSIAQDEYDYELSFIDQEYDLAFSNEDLELIEVLDGNKVARVHVHKADDIYYLVELKNKYGLEVTVEHACDVFEKRVFDLLAKENIPVVYGPLGGIGPKTELKNAFYQNAKTIYKSNATFGIMTDHPVISVIAIRDSMKYFMIHGMSDVEAMNTMTSTNAKILGIDDDLGEIKKDKLASLVVWNQDPFHFAAFPSMVMGEGKVLRK